MFEKENLRTLALPLTFIFLVVLAAVLFLTSSLTKISELSFVSFRSDAAEKELLPQSYVHNWDDNPVATIPETTMISRPSAYVHNWDNNPVATIPEATMISKPSAYVHNWDDNPVATIPETTMNEQP